MQSISQDPGFELPLAQLPGRMREALRIFRKITGLTAVTSLATSLPESDKPSVLSPPVHPRCASRLRSARRAPCRKQWLMHLRSGRRSPSVLTHTCPIGLRCSFVPVHFDGKLVGVAKLVADAETAEPAFLAAANVLELSVAGICQDSLVSSLSEEVGALRRCVAELQRIHSKDVPPATAGRTTVGANGAEEPETENINLVNRALKYLQTHYQRPGLSLPSVAAALECNPRYLTSRFTKIVGERMHRHLVRLRVAHACRLLLDKQMTIKEAAYVSGFNGPAPLARAFRRQVGVTPREYLRIFAAP